MSGRLWLRSPFESLRVSGKSCRLSPRRVAFGDRVSGRGCRPGRGAARCARGRGKRRPYITVALSEGPLDVDGTLQRLAGALEGEHEAVALALYLEAAVGLPLLAHDGVVLPQQLQPALVAEPVVHGRRALDVAEHDRDGAVRRGVRPQVRLVDVERGGYGLDGRLRARDVDPLSLEL